MLILMGIVLLVYATSEASKRRDVLLEEWRAAAAELGLDITPSNEYDRALHGELDGVLVRAELKYQREQGKATGFRVTMCAGGQRRIPGNLVVRRDSLGRSMSRLVDGKDEQLGDPRFDELVELPTLDAWDCAALSFAARQQLARLVQLGGEVGYGVASFDQAWSDDFDRVWLAQMLHGLTQLTHSLSVTPDSLHQRLAENATQDPLPGVRVRNLGFLADPGTQAPQALRVSVGEALLGDPEPRLRLLAAQLVGVRGHGVLTALAGNPQLDTPLRISAVTALGRPPTPAFDVLRALLEGVSAPELLCEALAVVGQQGLQPLADAVLGCTRSEHDSVRAAAASALGGLAHAPAERVLIALLTDHSAEVQRTSAAALGALGSVAAVEPLLPLAEGLGRPQLRRAARGAIGRIQARLVGVEAGRVSLAEEHALAGAVQLADTSAARIGDLSLAEQLASDDDSAAGQKRAAVPFSKPR